MDQVGNLELSWAQGYNGGKISYIDKDVICYLCGSNVKFVAEDGAETVFHFPGEGVGPFAVHTLSRCFAVAEQCLNPKIYVYVYPTFRQMAVLEGGAQLEYSQMFFSSSEYLCSLSGIPEFELVLWNFSEGTKLCTFALSNNQIPTSISFNPANWRQICMTTETSVTMLSIEQSDKYFVIQPTRVRLPAVDPEIEEEEEAGRTPTRASTRMSRYTVEVPKAAKAGLVGEMAERLDDIQDAVERVKPVSQVWTPIGDVFVGCKGGQLIKIDGESLKGRVLYYPPPPAESPGSRMSSAGFQRESILEQQPPPVDVNKIMLEGSMSCLGLHKRGLYCGGQDGVLRMIDLKSRDVSVLEDCQIGYPITALTFSPSYRHIALGSAMGTLHLYEPGVTQSIKLLKNLHYGQFVAIAILPGNEHCVTCREDGMVQVWSVDKGHLVSTFPVGVQALSMTCSPMLHVCAVGTASGHIYYLDLTTPEEPRIVQRVKIYDGSVAHLVYDSNGTYLFTASNDGHVFVVDGRATVNFKPLAHTMADGEVQALASYTMDKTVYVVVTHNTSGNKRMGANHITTFQVDDNVINDLRPNCHSLKYDFKDAAIQKVSVKLAVPSYGAAITEGRTVYTLSQNNKNVHQHTLPLPEELPKGKELEKLKLEAVSEAPGHQLPGGRVLLSPHHKWLASYGTDGSMMLRTIGQMDNTVTITPHDYRSGGVRTMAFGEDSQNVFTTGYDGVLTCFAWNPPTSELDDRSFSPTGLGKAKSAMEAARARKSKLMSAQKEENECLANMDDWEPGKTSRPSSDKKPQTREDKERIAREAAVAKDEIYRTPTPTPAEDATWLQVQELESFKEEDRQYADTKKTLRESIRDMRRTLQTMLKNNETLPEIERLNRHEFDLDIEEQMRLQAEADQEVERVREEIEFENLAKMYLREMIKRECWDAMEVKGRAVQAFNSNLEVSNFPMRERPQEFVKMIEKVTKRRQIEIAEAKAIKENVETEKKSAPTTADDELGDMDDDNGKEQPSITGSLGAQYGGGSELFYSQFELHTREQKINQIVLLEDALHRIKQVFNKDFDDLFIKKEQEIGKISEKNKRIRKIIEDLDVAEKMIEPSLSVAEKPEIILTVDDDEVKVERYYTPEQQKELVKKKKEEEERKARERGDNIRERALADMMGGVLEVKKEDELKKDIPKPSFMLQKEEDDWTEDEQKLFKEYEKKVKELQEEREKYRKQLETELKKNQSLIQEGMANFDELLNQVFMKKIKVMMVIYQEELKILRLRHSLLVEEELETQEAELNRMFDHKRHMKQLAAEAVVATRKNVEAYREQYDILIAEDKVMDKAFKREFNDVSAVQQDQLYRLFRRRPRELKMMKHGFSTSSLTDTHSMFQLSTTDRALKITKPEGESTLPNPFADRPSTARQNAQAKAFTDTSMDELDKDSNCPEGVEPPIWQRLCMYRRQKVENENLVKVRAQVLAEMNAFLQRRIDEDECLRHELDSIQEQINKLHNDRARFNLNLEVQLLLKQGQVEVDSGSFIHNFKDSALIHRGVVEDLNQTIKTLGESKIASMVESKDFRKGIIQLEWEHKKMLMQMEDFQNRMKDIQFMKVTREIQLYLNSPDYDGRKSEEVGKLELTILQKKRLHEKTVDERKKTLKELERTIRTKENDNEQLLKELEDLNVSVHERKHIEDVNADRRTNMGTDKRYAEIVQRRKLVDLAKAQAQEVAVLRAEVERLRMRTFPALVQVEH